MNFISVYILCVRYFSNWRDAKYISISNKVRMAALSRYMIQEPIFIYLRLLPILKNNTIFLLCRCLNKWKKSFVLSLKLNRLSLLLSEQYCFISTKISFRKFPGYSECKRAQSMAARHELKRKTGLRARLVTVRQS